MDNFSNGSGRRIVTDAAGLNRFLTRMYGNMTLAVLVSALSAYLTMTVFRAQVMGFFGQHPAMVWIILLLPIALSMGVSFSATWNPVGGFVMLMLTAIIYGVEFALIGDGCPGPLWRQAGRPPAAKLLPVHGAISRGRHHLLQLHGKGVRHLQAYRLD